MRAIPLVFLCVLACEVPGVRKGAPETGSPETGDPGGEGSGGGEDTVGDDPVGASVRILSPADGATVENPVTFTIAADGVATVALDADGYALGEAWDPSVTDELSYSFNGTGYERLITLTGYDATGAALATDQVTITVAAEGVQLDVPYFYQYDNAYEPSATCGVTSAAMMVDTWNPGSVTPDSLYLRYGKAQGQSPAGLAELYEWEGLYADWTTTGTRDQIRAHLDAGRPVVAHGWWTSAGHVVIIIGYDEEDWIVNDPAGDWYDCYGCGGGEAVHYPLDGAWDEEMSVDGDLWFSVASSSAF